MKTLISSHNKILMEGAVVEQLRHCFSVALHPTLIHAPLIYDTQGRRILSAVYRSYLEIAAEANLPFLMGSPTWRTNFERVTNASISTTINTDALRFMQEIRDQYSHVKNQIKIGGIIGCKGDAYQPSQGLSCAEAVEFHSWQIRELAAASPDFIIAETMPCLEEAKCIALVLEKTAVPYFISFVINREGCLLDNTPLFDAINSIDKITKKIPAGYMVNCSYPSFLRAQHQPKNLFTRLIGFLANGSSLDHCDLDQSSMLKAESATDWAIDMLELNQKYGIKVLGGCCGTNPKYLKAIASAHHSQ